MSRSSRWLRPVMATASIVALGAASVVVGSFFAPGGADTPPGAPSTFATQAFPVLAPVGYGESWGNAGFEDALGLSYEQGTREVRVDADGMPDPGASVRDAAEVLSASPDPVVDDWGIEPVGGSDDPCAPVDGSPADGTPSGDCPEGLRGATFSVISPDSLWAMFRANPPVEIANPYEIAHCPAVEVSENALRYSVVTNAPGAIRLQYWPRGDERAVTTINLTSSPPQTAAWEAGLADADAFEGDWTTLQHCAILDGLEKYVAYDYELHIEDVLGREFTSSRTMPFSLPDDRTAPEFRVTPLGANAILASAPHRENSEVRFNVQVIDPGDTDDCSLAGDDLPIVDMISGKVTVDVDPEYLADHGYLPGYTKRTNLAIHVPSGSTVLVCAGVYEDNRPGWQWHEAQFQYSTLVQTPGGPRPVVTVDRVNLKPGYDDTRFRIDGRFEGTAEHLTCYLWDDTSGSGGACGDGPHDITRGDFWVTASAKLGDEWTRYSAVLPLGAITCEPGCDAPDTRWYTIPIKLQERPGERCGSGIVGPCPETVIGEARISVEWGITEQARRGDHWVFTPPRAGAVEHELHPLPQLDWLAEPEIIDSTRPNSSAARFMLKVDRPVSYRAELIGDCTLDGTDYVVEGETRVSAALSFYNLCKGERYSLRIALEDEAGSTNLFGVAGNPLPYGSFFTPGFVHNVVLGQTLGLHEDSEQLLIRQYRVKVDGQSITPSLPENRCVLGNTFERPPSAVLESATLGEWVTVEVTVQLAAATGSSDGSRAYCNSTTETGPVYTSTRSVPIDYLRRGIVIATPTDSPYLLELTLRLGNPT